MRGATPPLPQYAFMAWRSVKAQGQLYFVRAPLSGVEAGSSSPIHFTDRAIRAHFANRYRD
jgi:hypothetical protein